MLSSVFLISLCNVNRLGSELFDRPRDTGASFWMFVISLWLQRNLSSCSSCTDPASSSLQCIQFGPYEIPTSSVSHYPADCVR